MPSDGGAARGRARADRKGNTDVSSSGPAWCFSPRKPLSLRRRAPRPQARTGLPPIRRGASSPANPCPFVDGHHALRPKREFLRLGVVLLSSQTLVPSSAGTTPPGTNRPSTNPAWYFSPRKSLFFRRRAPRPRVRTRVPPARRGASPPANPCSLVDKHHAEPAFRRLGVVLLSPQTLVPSSMSTTPPGTNRPSSGPAALRCWKRHRRFLLLPTKKQTAHCTVRAMRLSSQ